MSFLSMLNSSDVKCIKKKERRANKETRSKEVSAWLKWGDEFMPVIVIVIYIFKSFWGEKHIGK